MNYFMSCLALFVVSEFAIGSEFPVHQLSGGVWEVPKSKVELPKLRLDIDPKKKNISVTFQPGNKTEARSIGITLFDSEGNKTEIELKAMDRTQDPFRYQAPLDKAESFVGFELKIPFTSPKAKTIKSADMVRVSDLNK